jgi:hypothetical protein
MTIRFCVGYYSYLTELFWSGKTILFRKVNFYKTVFNFKERMENCHR